jgi:hypothetical protein
MGNLAGARQAARQSQVRSPTESRVSLRRYKADVPWETIKSSLQAAERLREEDPERFDAIVSEGIVAQPELEGKDPLSLVTLYLYDQRVKT